MVKQAHLIILEDAWIKLYKRKNVSLYNIENTLEEVISGNKLLPLGYNVATNILIGQLIGKEPVFNNSIGAFEFKERNSIKENIVLFYKNKGKKIKNKDLCYIKKEIEREIKREKLDNELFEIDSYNNKRLGTIEIKTPNNKCKKYIDEYLETHFAT